MRTHGWGGDPPADDDEARRRIVGSVRAALLEGGSGTTSQVAGRLGVTRQTVYRYFASTDELLDAAALAAVDDLQVQLVEHLGTVAGDVGEAMVEVVVFVYDHLRTDPALKRLLAPGRLGRTIAGLTAPSSITLGRSWLRSLPVDWESTGLDEAAQRELVEHLLRMLQSHVLDPGTPERTGDELRAYLRRWVAPALGSRSGAAGT